MICTGTAVVTHIDAYRELLIINMYIHVVCTATTYLWQSMDQPRKVAKPARGQLNREDEVSLQTHPW